MVIANANRIGNCNLLKLKRQIRWNLGMRGIRTASPSKGPVKIVASFRFSIVIFYGKSRAIAKLWWVDIS